MARYIDADELLKTYKEWLTQLSRPEDKGDRTGVETCIAVLENTSTEDVVGVKHGEWKEENWMTADQHICSLCFSTVRVHPQSVEYKFCPYCGAKMDGKE